MKSKSDEKSSLTPNSKPKLFIHVGPLKTGTTTIQQQVIGMRGILGTKDLARDDIFYKALSWMFVSNLVNENNWEELFKFIEKQYKIVYKSGINNMLLSHESLSFARTTKSHIQHLKRLETKFDVRIIMVYRPLETWYKSSYNDDRYLAMYKKKTRNFRPWFPSVGYNVGIAEWFEKNWIASDPLQTYETFQELFGKEKVHVLSLDRPDGVDISEQFVCEALEAQHSCETLKKNRRKMTRENTSQHKLFYDYDLLAMGALNRRFLRDNDECKRIERHQTALLIESYFKEKHLSLEDIPQVCISESQKSKLYDRAWQAEQKLAHIPRQKSDFDESFKKEMSKYCSVDVESVLSLVEWESFFRKDERLCQT